MMCVAGSPLRSIGNWTRLRRAGLHHRPRALQSTTMSNNLLSADHSLIFAAGRNDPAQRHPTPRRLCMKPIVSCRPRGRTDRPPPPVFAMAAARVFPAGSGRFPACTRCGHRRQRAASHLPGSRCRSPSVLARTSATASQCRQQTDEYACHRRAVGPARLPEGAKSRGANAVVDIVSYYKKTSSAARQLRALRPLIMAGVALKEPTRR